MVVMTIYFNIWMSIQKYVNRITMIRNSMHWRKLGTVCVQRSQMYNPDIKYTPPYKEVKPIIQRKASIMWVRERYIMIIMMSIYISILV